MDGGDECKILVSKRSSRRPLERMRQRSKNNTKKDNKDICVKI
jgi:hypothetical protein